MRRLYRMTLEMLEIDSKGKSAPKYTHDFLRHLATGAPYWPSIAHGTHVTFFKMKVC
jgi:hypothetical protein